ncbi:hypothetical protein CCAX7_52020 [Capsulimonas corticalis]|uniref:Uncharacterized protein n=1 Tax=Capsulimonas corticalis TaxID=2219043 RepID=A0A402CP28_9BACT|nr:hypothetical protein CCAX7_52020 [Capsulimonas corticalis]
MWQGPEFHEQNDDLYLAGQRVHPGRYKQVGGNGRSIVLEQEDVLPASLDGRVACYQRVNNTWDQISRPRQGEMASTH